MPPFASESEVRSRFGLIGSESVTSEAIETALEDAHEDVMRWLGTDVDQESPPEAVILGEVMLAGAVLYRMLAAGDAAQTGPGSLDGEYWRAGVRIPALYSVAELVERKGWYLLEPYTRPLPRRLPLHKTKTQSIFL